MGRTLLIICVVVISAQACLADISSTSVLNGPIDGWLESHTAFIWGDGTHDLKQNWSVQSFDSSGYFYSGNYDYLGSNADVYNAGPVDPLTVANAAAFAYNTTTDVIGHEGDTIFFRGFNGYYGAWTISDIYQVTDLGFHARLNGHWYFQPNQTADFTTVPEPATAWLLGVTAVVLRRRRRGRPGRRIEIDAA